MWEHWMSYSDSAVLVFLTLWQYCVTLCWSYYLLPSCLGCHLHYPSSHSSKANFRCPICFQVHYPHHCWQDGSGLVWFGGHSITEFVVQGGPVQTKLMAQVIFTIIQMQLHHHFESLNRIHEKSSHYPKWILLWSVASFGYEAPSI